MTESSYLTQDENSVMLHPQAISFLSSQHSSNHEVILREMVGGLALGINFNFVIHSTLNPAFPYETMFYLYQVLFIKTQQSFYEQIIIFLF